MSASLTALLLAAAGATPFAGFEHGTEKTIELPVIDRHDRRPAETMSLEQAILSTLENHPGLQSARLGTAIAAVLIDSERAVYDPAIFVDLRYNKEKASQIARSTGQRFDVDGQSTRARIGLRQKTPIGTEIEVALEHDFDDSDRTPRQQAARVGISVTQALLRGLAPRANLATITSARLELDASFQELSGYSQALLAQTERRYWVYALATRELGIHSSAVSVAERELEATEARISAGTAPRLERAVAQSELARRRQSLIDAKSRSRAASLNLCYAVGWTPPNCPSFRVSEPTTTPTLDRPDESVRIRLARNYRPDLKEARLRLEQGHLELVVSQNGLLPKLDLMLDFYKTGFGERFGSAFEALGEETYEVTAGIRFAMPLLNREQDAVHRGAQWTRRQSEHAIENLEKQIGLEVSLAVNEIERAHQQIEASRTTVNLRQAVVEAERERLSVGSGTALLLAQAQRDQVEAEVAHARALVDYKLAFVQLYLAEGTLLRRRGVRIQRP